MKKQTCPKKFYLHGVLFVEIYPWQISHLCGPGTTIVVYITNDLKASSLISAWTHSLWIQGKSERDYTIEFLLYVSLKLRSLIFLDISVISWRYFSIWTRGWQILQNLEAEAGSTSMCQPPSTRTPIKLCDFTWVRRKMSELNVVDYQEAWLQQSQ